MATLQEAYRITIERMYRDGNPIKKSIEENYDMEEIIATCTAPNNEAIKISLLDRMESWEALAEKYFIENEIIDNLDKNIQIANWRLETSCESLKEKEESFLKYYNLFNE